MIQHPISSNNNNNMIFATSPTPPPTPASKQPLPKSVIFATSGIGGCLGWAVVHPFNTIAVRSNLASASGQTFSLSKMLKQDGFRSLYDGLSAGVARQVFYATSRFGLFEIGRDLLHSYRGHTDFAAR
jgi:solute carrier family 25 (mitochondrial oxoglutarate transporter), member 11